MVIGLIASIDLLSFLNHERPWTIGRRITRTAETQKTRDNSPQAMLEHKRAHLLIDFALLTRTKRRNNKQILYEQPLETTRWSSQ